jgi:hypothetical protein
MAMSRSAVVAVIQASREPGRFSHQEFRVMVNLADHLNDKTGRCDPSLRLLEEETGLHRGQLRRTIEGLQERGELWRDPSKGGRGHRQQYEILLTKGYRGETL